MHQVPPTPEGKTDLVPLISVFIEYYMKVPPCCFCLPAKHKETPTCCFWRSALTTSIKLLNLTEEKNMNKNWEKLMLSLIRLLNSILKAFVIVWVICWPDQVTWHCPSWLVALYNKSLWCSLLKISKLSCAKHIFGKISNLYWDHTKVLNRKSEFLNIVRELTMEKAALQQCVDSF